METKVVLTERLDRFTCATLLIETVKYLLFHRYQIPQPFDQLKAEDERDRMSENARRSPRNRPLPCVLKKKRQLIANVEEVLSNIHQVFLQVDTFEVLLLLGATVVNPKEIYSIKFCNIGQTSDVDKMKEACLSGKENGFNSRSKFVDKCCRKLARALFTDPCLNERGELSSTSIHCFVLAPRKLDTTWFRPKVSFKVPKRGKSCVIKIYTGGDDGHVSTLGERVGETRTSRDDDLGGTSGDKEEHKRISGDEDDQVTTSEGNGDVRILEDNNSAQDTLWFQAPVVLKGYKEAYKETVESSIWRK